MKFLALASRTFKIPKTNSLVAVSIYAILSSVMYFYALFYVNHSLWIKALFPVFGAVFFTLIEYVAHRFLYHSGPDYKDEANWQYTMHGVHHVHPNDKGLLAMPIPLALVLAATFFGLFYVVMSDLAYFFWPGFLLGYAGYLYVHYSIHARKPPENIFGYLWKHHLLHHHIYDDKAFGVTTPLWDHVFGTMPPKKVLHRKNK